MIWLRLVVEVTDARDVRLVTVFLSPLDGFMLCFEGGKRVVGMGLDHVIFNGASFRGGLWDAARRKHSS